VTRVQEQQEKMKRTSEEIGRSVKATWDKVNETILADPDTGQYFKQREGDQEWNQRLGKGFQLVDKAFSQSPTDPRLTPEQRSEVIKRHAAVRNRAASWGALRHENSTLKQKLDAALKEIKGYKSSSPPAGGQQPTPQGGGEGGSARDRLLNNLNKIAKTV